MTQQELQGKICPLCGGDNKCAMAAGQPAESCWCQRTTIDRAVLKAVPAGASNKRCICPSCGQNLGESSNER